MSSEKTGRILKALQTPATKLLNSYYHLTQAFSHLGINTTKTVEYIHKQMNQIVTFIMPEEKEKNTKCETQRRKGGRERRRKEEKRTT